MQHTVFGGRGLPLIGHLPWLIADPIKFLTDLSRRYGDVAAFRLGTHRAVLLNHPDLIMRLLRDRFCPRSDQSRQGMRSFLGDGLLAIEGATHLQHRRLMAPAFHRERIRRYAELMCEETDAELGGWRSGEQRDLREDMSRLTFAIVSRALFSADRREEAHEVEQALAVILPWAALGAAFASVIPGLPVFYPPRGRKAVKRLRRLVLDIVSRRRAENRDRGDLMSMLFATRDEDGTGLTDEDICAETLTLLMAGHDTTANTLMWAWHLLTRHPEIQQALYEEVQRVVGDRRICPDDVPKLALVDQVISETLRLYPVVWFGDRVPERDIELGGHTVRKGTRVLFSMYLTQRDARFFPDPERFDPGRFSPERVGGIPAGAYLPFGSGSHMCIGNSFALMEARIILAAMVQRFALASVPDHEVRQDPQIVLTTVGAFPVRLKAREREPSSRGGEARELSSSSA